MKMPRLLLLCLEAPLQSWGVRARWDVRDTGDEPSKSGVIGLLGCALGYPVGDPRLVELDRELRMGVRVDSPGLRMIDYQTVTGVMLTADGKRKGRPDDPNTIISPRAYLQDASFLVALEGPNKRLEECAEALQNPMWPIYLGRKACVPTRPVFETLTDEYVSIESAFLSYPWSRGSVTDTPTRLRCVIEDEVGDYVRPDRLQPNPARMYGQRHVRIIWVNCPA